MVEPELHIFDHGDAVLQTRLDLCHPEEVFDITGVPQGLLVAPRTERKNLGGVRPDIFVLHAPRQGILNLNASHVLALKPTENSKRNFHPESS